MIEKAHHFSECGTKDHSPNKKIIPRGILVQKYGARGGMVVKNKFENFAKKTLNYFM
jgi:hypothetical protein